MRALERQGLVEQVSPGVWRDLRVEPSIHHSLVEPAFRAPQGVVCLLSALQFHGLTTQQPSVVWFAIANKAQPPKTVETRLRPIRMSEASLSAGVEIHQIEAIPVRIFCPAKTVADCFKFRNQVGLDVALEALRDCYRRRRASVADLLHYARICRVARVMQPYLETIIELSS
ncbi:type IV toxin-antitoxin system AbiEi family antitoxin domain-containing protein [Gloeobacter morelensis]|uniref:Transcriptional regulator n=1 Tax=Gloeobacter morelensis MG652769 TaxID=2781736 RepID=A0ABY3PNE1_9CYAN|nr:transcriptional regulator [Gloeobacter morelensis]UFP95187.1 transcriptional regulator [Gloeobacter morelensis MG652769]